MLKAIFVALLCAVTLVPIAVQADRLTRETLTLLTVSGQHVISAEIAISPQEQARGLMFRRSMGEAEGMLFLHDSPRELTMWMRNTLIPLDMIFIRADGIVHRIEADTEPHSERVIASQGRVSAVLELNAGTAAKLGLRPGDSVQHRHFKSAGASGQ